MSASTNIRQAGKVSIIDLAGRITLNDGAGAIRDAVQGVLAGGGQDILLNLGAVVYIDSSGLGELSSAYIAVSRVGGRLKLLNPQPKVDGILQVTRLYSILVAFTEESAALESFR